MLYRMLEVARDMHQALEERWSKGSPEVLIGTPDRVVKVYAIRRLAEVDQWDGEFLKAIKGSPTTWKPDCGPEPQMVDLEDREGLGGGNERFEDVLRISLINFKDSEAMTRADLENTSSCHDSAVANNSVSDIDILLGA